MATTLRFGAKTVTEAGKAERLVSEPTPAQSLFIMAKKQTGVNAGVVHIGDVTVDKTNLQFITLAVGGTWDVPLGDASIDLMEIWIDAATTGDGVVFSYVPG